MQGLVKRFFNEKEVTSTLVMDALFSGCKQLEEMSRAAETKKVRPVCREVTADDCRHEVTCLWGTGNEEFSICSCRAALCTTVPPSHQHCVTAHMRMAGG